MAASKYWKMLQMLGIWCLIVAMKSECQVIRPECRGECGNVTIPYPFGIEEGCALNDNFTIVCNDTVEGGPKATLHGGYFTITNISLINGTLGTYTYIAKDCYTKTGQRDDHVWTYSKLVTGGGFYFSATRNTFTVVGCDTIAILEGSTHEQDYISGCLSMCYNKSSVTNGSCSGVGCCQASIPKQLSHFKANLSSVFNHKDIWDFNPCSYAFIADIDYFNFSTDHLVNMPDEVPTILDWAVGDQTCTEAKKNNVTYACKDTNSNCQDSDNGPGYRCFCNSGYTGNAYLPGHCLDVDECMIGQNKCIYSDKCHNTDGNYTCSCPKWYHGDGNKDGTGCKLDKTAVLRVLIGTGIILVLLISASCLLCSYRRRRIHMKRKENFFKQNGGTILQDKMSTNESPRNLRIFKSEELEAATDNFNESNICGKGGYGVVYKGSMPDGTVVAIKKSKAVDKKQKEQFINEIMMLSQIRHHNVVKFLGCCFDVPEPFLVYEFITKGTLADHLHNISFPRMSWSTRLRVAAETAGVLAYLHFEHSPPIIHRDIKPENILLDDNLTSKVSDFGCSRLFPASENEMFTMVQGTLGYLDPEYLQTGQLTEKSDVYSFGVVIIELLTDLKAVSFDRGNAKWSLVNYFFYLTNEDSILENLDKGMLNEGNVKEILEVANIAKACVAVKGEERPSMDQVAKELEGLLTMSKQKWEKENVNKEEIGYLLGEVPNDKYSASSIQMAGYSGTAEGFMALDIDAR